MIRPTRRILIVDDDLDSLVNLSDILSDAGYETETANSGAAALELIDRVCPEHNCQFDLCLFDFKMPEMDGAMLLEEIRARDSVLKAIMITAYASDSGVQRAIAAGTWEVLRKPVDIRNLLGLIREAIDAD